MQPIVDLHCDLLCYLVRDEKRRAHDLAVRCAIPQLKEGNVALQTMAIYTRTDHDPVEDAEKQFNLFSTLPKLYPEFVRFENGKLPQDKIGVIAAIENASGLCNEEEPLDLCFQRLNRYLECAGPLLYISLTWNHENRFGGGNTTDVGLKRDGELLLEFLSHQGMAIDLSHTSDALAYEILEYSDTKGLHLIPIASHSNFREVCPSRRNLPDAIAQEIANRGGVIGLNFFSPFIGKQPEDFIRHIEHAHKLNILDHLCFGADFFYDQTLPEGMYPKPYYHPGFDHAGCYQHALSAFESVCTQEDLKKIANQNFGAFFERLQAKVHI